LQVDLHYVDLRVYIIRSQTVEDRVAYRTAPLDH